jgi:hypothetical protein
MAQTLNDCRRFFKHVLTVSNAFPQQTERSLHNLGEFTLAGQTFSNRRSEKSGPAVFYRLGMPFTPSAAASEPGFNRLILSVTNCYQK